MVRQYRPRRCLQRQGHLGYAQATVPTFPVIVPEPMVLRQRRPHWPREAATWTPRSAVFLHQDEQLFREGRRDPGAPGVTVLHLVRRCWEEQPLTPVESSRAPERQLSVTPLPRVRRRALVGVVRAKTPLATRLVHWQEQLQRPLLTQLLLVGYGRAALLTRPKNPRLISAIRCVQPTRVLSVRRSGMSASGRSGSGPCYIGTSSSTSRSGRCYSTVPCSSRDCSNAFKSYGSPRRSYVSVHYTSRGAAWSLSCHGGFLGGHRS